MKIIAWNCRGLGNGPAVRSLLALQKEEDPDILFLCETKMNRSKIEGLRWMIGLTNMVVKDCNGRSGGLAIFWRNGVNFHLRIASQLYIDGDVVEKDGFIWRFTGFYGEPSSEKKDLLWRALRTLNAARRRSCLVMGDFNEILFSSPQSCMDKFREALEECSLDDLGFSGDMFTWRNNRHTSKHYIRERLDRVVGDVEWCMKFPNFKVRNGDPKHSDHRPVIVSMEVDEQRGMGGGGSCFRFKASWMEEENCEIIVENAWKLSMNVRAGCVSGAIGDVAIDLWDWSKNILGDLEK
jgi:exonuclease III